MTNILFISGGRRVELCKIFKEWYDCNVYSYENDMNSAIGLVCDELIEGKKWNDPKLGQHIAKIIDKYNVNLVIPLMDEAIYRIRGENGVPFEYEDRIVCPDRITARKCWDKWKFRKHMIQSQYKDFYPEPVIGEYPIISKSRYGQASRGIDIIRSKIEDFPAAWQKRNRVVQRYIEGDEYSCDCFFDRRGKFISCMPRVRLRVAGGEVVDSISRKKPLMVAAVKHIGEELGGLRGVCNFQFIEEKNTNNLYLEEINCRFGGGSTITCRAGLDLVGMTLKHFYEGEEIKAEDYQWKENFLVRRTFRDHVIGVVNG